MKILVAVSTDTSKGEKQYLISDEAGNTGLYPAKSSTNKAKLRGKRNFNISTAGTITLLSSDRCKPVIIEDGEIKEERATIINISDDSKTIDLIGPSGKKESVTVEEYKLNYYKKTNNEQIKTIGNKVYLDISHYRPTVFNKEYEQTIILEELPVTQENTQITQESTQITQENTQIQSDTELEKYLESDKLEQLIENTSETQAKQNTQNLHDINKRITYNLSLINI